MGPKTLNEIREDVRRAFKAGGDDPIQKLEHLIAESKRNGEGGVEVLESLRRCLEGTGRKMRRTRRDGTKKQSPRG